VLLNEIASLDRTTGDYAGWDDTYAFASDGNEAYKEANLADETFAKNRFSLFAVVDTSGKTVFAKCFDLDAGKETPVPASLAEHLSPSSALVHHETTTSSVRGILLLPEGAFMVASRPILTSRYEGPIRGALVIGRALGKAEVDLLARVTHLALSLHRVADAESSRDLSVATEALHRDGASFAQAVNKDTVAAYTLVKDVYGRPALVLEARTGRDFYKQSLASVRNFLLSTVGMVLVLGMMATLAMERLVLSRLAKLSAFVRGVGANENLSARVSIPGGDELAELGGAVNGMLEALDRDSRKREEAQKALAESEEKYRKLVDDANSIIMRMDLDGNITFFNEFAQSFFGYTREEIIGKNVVGTIVPPVDSSGRDLSRHMKEVCQRTSEYKANENENTRKDGSRVWVSWTNTPIQGPDGRVAEILCVGNDITERKHAEEALGRERNLLRTLIDILPDCVYATDSVGRKILSNPADVQSIGAKSVEEVLGKTDLELFPEELARQYWANDLAVLRTGQPLVNREEPMRNPDGSTRWLLTSKVPLRDEKGEIIGVVGVGRDITERKAAEEKVEILSRFPDENPNPVMRVTPGGVILYANRSAAPVLEAWGTAADQSVPEDWRARIEAASKAAGPIQAEAACGDRVFAFTLARVAKAGYINIYGDDITERKKADEEIERLRQQIEFILGTTKTGLDIIDSHLAVRYVDPEWAKVYGSYAGRKCYDYFMGRSEPCPGCGVTKAIETKRVVVTEEILAKENNRPIQVTTMPFESEDGEWMVAEVNVDISERKHLEEQLLQAQKMEAIGQLAGGIAHDFNNLMTGILGYANILKLESQPGTSFNDAAKTIEKAAERASQLTKQLLGFARRGKFLRVPVDLHTVAHEVMGLLTRTIEKNISVTQRLRADSPWVLGDPGQIEQAILNLAVNARDAMPDGGELAIETQVANLDEAFCRTHPEATPGRYVLVSVVDTGMGIPKELQQRIFEPFFTTKESDKGTGMGLAMVYGIVKNHGGFIRLYSEVGHGARFDVYLPQSTQMGAPAGVEQQSPVRGTGRILLVDDEEVVRDVASRMLRNLGYEVAVAASGDEAVRHYRAHSGQVDLVIIDMIMPGMSGRECFLALKSVNPGIRAILSTGYGLDGKAQDIVDEGMRGFVQKPYTMRELSTAIANALSSKG
jgi:PAS domain S-box-containing protein